MIKTKGVEKMDNFIAISPIFVWIIIFILIISVVTYLIKKVGPKNKKY